MTEAQCREYMQKNFPDRISVPTADVESHSVDATQRTDAIESMVTPVRIRIHQVRNRLGDIDGYCAKYVIDGVVHSGLLQDDRPEIVRSVEFTHERANGDKD